MISCKQVFISVALLSTIIFGSPLTATHVLDGRLDLPAFRLPLNGSNRIVGGEEADVGQFPHQISMRLNFSGTFRHFCGGSIISERFILTAGHCYSPDFPLARYRVVVGAHLNNDADGQTHNVSRFIVHEDYFNNMTSTNSTLLNDIALIETATPIVFGQFAASIPLYSIFVGDGARAVTSGWGRTDVSEIIVLLHITHAHTIQITIIFFYLHLLRCALTIGWEHQFEICQYDHIDQR